MTTATASSSRPTVEAKRPRPHQETALTDVQAGFATGDRGQLVMACGTGKTLVALWAAERLAASRTVVFVPSLALLSQTLREWRRHSSRAWAALAVCSDETVASGDYDQVTGTAEEIAQLCQVTTDPERIASFLGAEQDSVIFATYHSAPQIAAAYSSHGDLTPFDLVVCDEAHRTVGNAGRAFSVPLDERALPARRRLFMTATPRLVSARAQRRADEDRIVTYGMDDEQVYGPVLHELSFAEAVEAGLLCDYRVVVSVCSEARYRGLVEQASRLRLRSGMVEDARALAAAATLLDAIEQYELGRIVTFHNRIERARDFAADLPVLAADAGKLGPRCGHVSSLQPEHERDQALDDLRAGAGRQAVVVTNARCLVEGVDVPALDGIAFIDPRQSPIDIVQAVGRVMRSAPGKTVGTIFIPVVVEDAEDGETVAVEDALSDGAFAGCWQVIRALRSHDERLAFRLDLHRRDQTVPDNGLPVEIVGADGPAPADFTRAFRARLVTETTERWHERYGELVAYYATHGQLPRTQTPLGGWLVEQRRAKRLGVLNAEREHLLLSVPRSLDRQIAPALSAAEREEVIRLGRDGLRPQEIVDRTGLSASAIAKARRKAGQTLARRAPARPSPPLTAAAREEVIRLHHAGVTGSGIAERTGYSVGVVYKALKKVRPVRARSLPLTDAQRAEIVRLRHKGLLVRQIAARTDLGATTVKRALRRADMMGARGLTGPEREEIVRLRRAGLRRVEITKQLGRSDTTVGQVLREAGLVRAQPTATTRTRDDGSG